MKYERTERFKRDYRKLSERDRQEFKRVVLEVFKPALKSRQEGSGAGWPPALRIKGVEGAPGVWEMTWSFTDPDGRATWEWIKIDGETAVRWRRVGSHAVFVAP